MHSFAAQEKDEVRFTIISKAIHLTRQERNDTLLFFLLILRGNLLYDQQLINQAKTDFIHAVSIGKKNQLPLLNELYNNLAAIMFRKKEYSQALHYYNLIKCVECMPNETRSTIYNNKALCYAYDGESRQAVLHHLQSIKLKETLKDSLGLAISYLNLGDLYYDEYETSTALNYWNKSIELARKLKSDEVFENASFNLSLLYENNGNYKQALQYYKNSDSAGNRLIDREKIWKLSEIEKKLALQNKQLEITELENTNYKTEIKLNQRSTQRNISITIALGLLLVSGIVTAFLIQRNKASKIIHKQKTELETLNKTKDRIFSIIAHDLKSPISSLLKKNKLALDYMESGDHISAKTIIYHIRKDTEQTNILLNNLLHWSFTETGNLFILPQPLLLKACIEQITDELQFASKEKNICFEISVPDQLIVNTDLNSMKIILRNLLQNAIKFSYLNQKINIICKQENDIVYISIRDYGIGIPDTISHNLFIMDNNKIRKGTDGECGSGLGLWLINYLLQKNNGFISVNKQIKQGTEITVQLNPI